MEKALRALAVLTLVLGFGLISTGAASASTDSLSEPWGNAEVDVTMDGGTLEVEVTLKDTASDGKCVYVEYRADVRAAYQFAPDPDGVVARVCGNGESITDSIRESIILYNLYGVEIKLCKKGILQDPCVKKWVEPTYI